MREICKMARAFGGGLGHLVFGVFQKTAGRQRVVGAFGLFGAYSLEGYVCTRGRSRRSRILCLDAERMPQMPQMPQIPHAVLRLGIGGFAPNDHQTGPKWGWSGCRT